MKSNGEDFIIKGGTLHYCQYEAGEPVEHDDWAFVTPDDSYFDTVQQESKVIDSSTGQFALRIFLWRGLSSAKLSSYKDKITKQQFARGTTNLKDKDNDPEGTKYYVPSLMFLTPKTFVIEIYKNNGTTQASTTYGGMDWARFNKTGLIERMVKDAVKDGEIVFDGTQKNTYIHNYRSQTLKQFKNICNVAYENQKTRIKWANTGIYAGIYTGIILFLGLMIFVLTRGKNNPFKYLNIWHTQKIAWWAAFTPAVLGMILAFVFSGNMIGQMAFILLVSLRTMWMSMKQLRPQYQQQ